MDVPTIDNQPMLSSALYIHCNTCILGVLVSALTDDHMFRAGNLHMVRYVDNSSLRGIRQKRTEYSQPAEHPEQ